MVGRGVGFVVGRISRFEWFKGAAARRAGTGTLLALLISAPGVSASSAPDAGRPFEPPGIDEPSYGIRPPSATSAQRQVVRGADGTELYVETWLPEAKDGNEPPPELPTVLNYSPYQTPGVDDSHGFLQELVPRGYAYSQAHVRGTGRSGGCLAQTPDAERSDGARIVEYLGRDAPWADGNVGMFGGSYRGGTQLATATWPDPERLQYLKALVPMRPVASVYEAYNHDGVPQLLRGIGDAVGSYFVYSSLLPTLSTAPEKLLQRPGCLPGVLLGAADVSGDYSAYYRARDWVLDLGNLKAATFVTQGQDDNRTPSLNMAGFFDRIPPATPRTGLFGVFDHEQPDDYSFNADTPAPRRDWERSDFPQMVVAWYDRYLRGHGNDVEEWPVAQVQGTDGQWRAADDWPHPSGPQGALALGAGGVLGTPAPRGSSSYLASMIELDDPSYRYPPGTAAVWQSPPLTDRLEITGLAELDAWVILNRRDAHLAAKLEAIGPDGQRTMFEARIVGLRSMRHLQPFDRERFRQTRGIAPPARRPVHATVRFNPGDLVIPAGGKLRLTIAGSVIVSDGLDSVQEGLGAILQGPSLPSLRFTRVTVLHDCRHPTVLRFAMPPPDAELLNVREKDEGDAPLADNSAAPTPPVDGGGIASTPFCR